MTAPETAAGARHDFVAEAAEAGQRLDRMLAARLPHLSRSRIKGLIEGGCLTGDERALTAPSTKVKAGQRFCLIVPPVEEARPQGQALPLDVVYEDAHLIVIDKAAGMVVHPAPGNPDRTLVNALIAHCGDSLTGVGGVRRPGIVHRLDKDTSGLMVAAKTEPAHRGLVEQFAARTIERAYDCLVWGRPRPAEGEIRGNIGRSPRNRKKMAVLERGGKPAVTRYSVLKSFAEDAVSLVECRLLTGRTHQIRVHMTAQGFPLLGDPLYGGRGGRGGRGRSARLPAPAAAAARAFARQALHAKLLGFHHPATGQWLTFNSALPPDMRDLTRTLELL